MAIWTNGEHRQGEGHGRHGAADHEADQHAEGERERRVADGRDAAGAEDHREEAALEVVVVNTPGRPRQLTAGGPGRRLGSGS